MGILRGLLLIIYLVFVNEFTLLSNIPTEKMVKPLVTVDDTGYFFKTKDGCHIFVYDYRPNINFTTTLYIISGITGINHNNERDVIDQLSNGENRIVVIHPRGTGYSEGIRGDISDFSLFIKDYIEIIKNDTAYQTKQQKIFLYGHSMSTSILLALASELDHLDGAVLVNPPYILKNAKGMSPSFWQYIKYAYYMIFAKHKPIVNMAGDPSLIENEEDRKESEQRLKDSLLVKYFSMYSMIESKKIMDSMIHYTQKANYPLLLIYGAKDNIVDQKGCDLIFDTWQHEIKNYVIIENGSHGKSSVIQAKRTITNWIDKRKLNDK